MTDNEITKEKTFSEELPHFKERIKEVFDNYNNPNGNEDPLYICVLRDSKRVVRKAEEEITRQQTEIERLQKEVNLVSIQFQDLQEETDEIRAKAYTEFAEKLEEKLGCCHIISDGEYCGFDCGDTHECIDNLLKKKWLMCGRMTCKDCIHNEVCHMREVYNNIEEQVKELGCMDFIARADVQEIKHGEWIKMDIIPDDGDYYCSECRNFIDIATGRETPIDRGFFYCPNCGAKMDGGAK